MFTLGPIRVCAGPVALPVLLGPPGEEAGAGSDPGPVEAECHLLQHHSLLGAQSKLQRGPAPTRTPTPASAWCPWLGEMWV